MTTDEHTIGAQAMILNKTQGGSNESIQTLLKSDSKESDGAFIFLPTEGNLCCSVINDIAILHNYQLIGDTGTGASFLHNA